MEILTRITVAGQHTRYPVRSHDHTPDLTAPIVPARPAADAQPAVDAEDQAHVVAVVGAGEVARGARVHARRRAQLDGRLGGAGAEEVVARGEAHAGPARVRDLAPAALAQRVLVDDVAAHGAEF